MTTLREAAEMALEALEWAWGGEPLGTKEIDAITALREALAQPEREPVAIVVAAEYEDGSHAGHHLEWRGRNEANDYPEGTKLYTHPPQRKPLTDEEIDQLSRTMVKGGKSVNWLCRAIEQAHGIVGEQ